MSPRYQEIFCLYNSYIALRQTKTEDTISINCIKSALRAIKNKVERNRLVDDAVLEILNIEAPVSIIDTADVGEEQAAQIRTAFGDASQAHKLLQGAHQGVEFAAANPGLVSGLVSTVLVPVGLAFGLPEVNN